MTPDDAIRSLADATAEAATAVLRTHLPDAIEIGAAEVVPEGVSPLDGVAIPAVAVEVLYAGGVHGGTVLVTTLTGARTLAAAVTGSSPVPGGHPLDLAERDALTKIMDAIADGAADAMADLLGQNIAPDTPEIRALDSVVDAVALTDGVEQAAQVTLSIAGEPARLAQLLPSAVVDEISAVAAQRGATGDRPAGDAEAAGRAVDEAAIADDILRGVQLRVCAEIGRAAMPMSDAVAIPPGGLVELDRGPEEPVDVLVNGRRFATGRLVLVDGEWAVRIEEVLVDTAGMSPATAGAAPLG